MCRLSCFPAIPGSRDLRTEFEKDYHRIIGSASFRRLQDKTERLYLRLLLVTDEICGMTDSYAKGLYQKFSGIK